MVVLIIYPSQCHSGIKTEEPALTDPQSISICDIIVRQTLVVTEFVSLPRKYWFGPFAQSSSSDGILQTGDFGGWVDF